MMPILDNSFGATSRTKKHCLKTYANFGNWSRPSATNYGSTFHNWSVLFNGNNLTYSSASSGKWKMLLNGVNMNNGLQSGNVNDYQFAYYEIRTGRYLWCHIYDNNSCLEIYGLQNMSPNDFTKLLRQSIKHDLSELRAAFTPDIKEMREMGILPQEFIVSCNYDQKSCSYKDFYQWQSDQYGNCYTFNSPNLYESVKVRNIYEQHSQIYTDRSGDQNGLTLTLNLDIENYVSLVTPGMGVRVVVHNPSVSPVPEKEGFSVAPGITTSVKIKTKRVYRMGQPHGHCHPNTWSNIPRKYSQTSCWMLCLEKRIQENCKCSYAINDLLQSLDDSLPRCNPTNLQQDLCRQIQMKAINIEGVCDCPPACNETVYTPEISTIQTNLKFYKILENRKHYYVGDDVCSGSNQSTVRLHIYLDNLQEEIITEKPCYSFTSFIAHLGGILAFFIGFSLITLMEIMEFVMYLWLLLGRKVGCCENKITAT